MHTKTLMTGVKAINALRSTGVIIQVQNDVFLDILKNIDSPIVVTASKKYFFTSLSCQYLTNYKGLFFWVETEKPLQLPEGIELVEAKEMLIPMI